MLTKGQYKEDYNETHIIDTTTKLLTLTNSEDKSIPYHEYSKIQLKLYDSPGKTETDKINLKFFSGLKTLIILFDLTNENSYNNIKNRIEISENIFLKIKNNSKNVDDTIKQPECFKDIPILLVGNKSDIHEQQKVNKSQVEELIKSINEKTHFTMIKYYEISVKENKGIDDIFQDIIFYYFKRKIDISKPKQPTNNENKINAGEKEKKEQKKDKPSLDKSMLVFHQMLDKYKKKLISEMSTLKEENKDELIKQKKLEEKLELLNNDFNNEKKTLKEQLELTENKTNELEKELKTKNEEIENLKLKVNELLLFNKEVTLKFKISNENVQDEISINATGETKVYEVLTMLYELCPSINNLNIKGFCLEGKENEIIDEMKTVNENKLVNGSMIMLIL